MTDKPGTTYIVSVYEKPYWRTVLTTKDKAKAEATLKEIGKTGQIEEIIPRVKRRKEKSPAPKGMKRPVTQWVKPGLIGRVKHLRGEEDLRHASLQDFREEGT